LNARRIPHTGEAENSFIAIEDITNQRGMQKEITIGFEKKLKKRT
jgi:hypothetical protein